MKLSRLFGRVMMVFLLALCGCHTSPRQVTYVFGERRTGDEVQQAALWLGECPAEPPGDAVCGFVYEVSGTVDRRADLGMCVGSLPQDVDVVVMLLNGARTTGTAAAHVATTEQWDSAAGTLKTAAELRRRLLSEGGCQALEALPEALSGAVREMALLLKVRYGEVLLLPVVLEGGGISRTLAGVLLRELFKGRAVLVGCLPAGTGEQRPQWREELTAAFRSGWQGQRVTLAELAVVELSRQLGMRPAMLTRPPVRGARLRQAPEKLRSLTALAMVETPRSAGVKTYGLEHASQWLTDDVYGEVVKGRERTDGSASYDEAGLNEAEQAILLALVRQSLERAVRGEPLPLEELPQYSQAFLEPRGCSVTLWREGKMQAQVMAMGGKVPLLTLLLQQCGRLAQDKQKPLTAELLRECQVELGVMSLPRRVEYGGDMARLCRQLTPGRDGVILRAGGKAAGFVPQVWGQFRQVEDFVTALCRRCGQTPDVLRQQDTQVSVFTVQLFRERR